MDWDLIEQVTRETGKAVRIGRTDNFSRRAKAAMSAEARKRHLNITLGNSERDPQEKDDELYVMAKL